MDHNVDEPIDGDNDSDNNNNNSLNSIRQQQWTCDACGCNTNIIVSDRNCTICGTPHNTNPHIQLHQHHGNHPFGHHHLGGISSDHVRRAAVMAVSSNLNISSSNNNNSNNNNSTNNAIPYGYAAAIRAGWLDSLTNHAARTAGSNINSTSGNTNNNSSNITAVQQAAAAAASSSMVDGYSFDDDDDVWESVMNGAADPTGRHIGAQDPLELQLSLGMSNYAAVRQRYIAESNRQQRFLQLEAASRAFTHSIREPIQPSSPPRSYAVEPDELLRAATINSSIYQPSWVNLSTTIAGNNSPTTSTRSSRYNSASFSALHNNSFGIEIWGDGLDRNQVAHVLPSALEGRAIRAEQSFPRAENTAKNTNNSFDPFRLTASLSPTNSNDSDSFDLLCNAEISSLQQYSSRSRIFGFRVAFDNPALTNDDATSVGMDLGGCFLVGVTSSSFSSYVKLSTLQESNTFWGIEDHGRIYEGSNKRDIGNNTYTTTTARTSALQGQQDRRRPYSQMPNTAQSSSANLSEGAAASLSMDINDAPSLTEGNNDAAQMNTHKVLFGIRDVITVICNLDHRSLTFWRNETPLGTLILNLPRGVDLYPIAVPFNAGATVAISGISCDPLQMLRSYGNEWREKQEEKNLKIRCKLAKDRATLIKDGKPTVRLQKVLRQIFSWYLEQEGKVSSGEDGGDELSITGIMAARLWYRCGMKLSTLEDILKRSKGRTFSFLDFFGLITEIVEDDEIEGKSTPRSFVTELNIDIGDKVELVEGFEVYRDATSGPLQVGDRGVVVEMQRGPNGEKRSVRVLHSGRRWWYLVQAVIAEKSGLIESPAVWFLNNILRSHGFDHTTLTTILAKAVTPTSWRIGDVVTHKNSSISATKKLSSESICKSMIGRVVVETSTLASSSSSASSPIHNRPSSTVTVEFVSGSFADAVGVKPANPSVIAYETRRIKTNKLVHTTEIHGNLLRIQPYHDSKIEKDVTASSFDTVELFSASINEKVVLDIEAIEALDVSAINSITKQCKKSSDALASMFSSGLPNSILTALSLIERQMNSLEPKDDLPDKLSAIGHLVNALTEQLYSNNLPQQELDDMDIEVADSSQSTPWQNAPQSVHNRESHQPSSYRSLRRETSRIVNQRESSRAMISSIQQRNNLLLSLMSRATHVDDERASINDTTVGGDTDSSRHVPPPMRGSSPFHFGAFNEVTDNIEHSGSPSTSQDSLLNEEDIYRPRDLIGENPLTFKKNTLDSILRSYGSVSSPSTESKKQGGAAYAGFIRHLISCGVSFDSAEWADALIAGYCKNFHGRSQAKALSILRGVMDEEGTHILVLAIALGCGVDVIKLLIKYGASVGSQAVVKAAITGQTRTLAVLLQHTSYQEGLIDIESCDPSVQQLLHLTKLRQDELNKKMEDAAGGFMHRLVMKLFELGLITRQIRNPRIDKCSKIICEILVGNVLLRALHINQKETSQQEKSENRDAAEPNDHTIPSEIRKDSSVLPTGLLSYLPESVFRDYLFRDVGNITKFLLLCEDFLCSKNLSDVASGLTFLSITLAKSPSVKCSAEVERFGISEFVSNHNVLSSNRIADILSNELNVGLDVSGHSARAKEVDSTISLPKSSRCGVVLCPKKHTASLHFTQHSNFRCDICGHAVPEGEFIFGCRECDYDECVECTVKDGKRTLCVNMVILELAVECQRILSEGENQNQDIFRKSQSSPACNEELTALGLRLLQRDSFALRDLGKKLIVPGSITIHEFLTLILPSLHASLAGQVSNSDGLMARSWTNHRNKKARSSRDSDDETLDSHVLYCRESLINISCNQPHVSLDKKALAANSKVLEYSFSEFENKKVDDDKGEKLNISNSASISELLRRLHQVLSFYESVQVVSATFEKRNLNGNSDDLHQLTKPFELILVPSSHNLSRSVPRRPKSVIYAEPLVPLSDLQLHVIRANRINNSMYISFCQSLALDKATIVERPKSNSAGPWRIATVESYDESTGGHILRYASGWKRGKERSTICLESSCDDFSYFTYDNQVLLILAMREYYILSRKGAKVTPIPEKVPPIPNKLDEALSDSSRLIQAIGSRVESSCSAECVWKVLTLVGIDAKASEESHDGLRYILVSDDGEIFKGVPSEQIRARGSIVRDESARQRQFATSRLTADDRNSFFPFLAVRDRIEFGERLIPSLSEVHNQTKALKRTWSALSLMNDMRPIDLKVSNKAAKVDFEEDQNFVHMDCKLNELTFQIFANRSFLELPPVLAVHFSSHEKLPTVDLMVNADTTLIGALKELHQKQKKWSEWPTKTTRRLFFSFEIKSLSNSEKRKHKDPIREDESLPLHLDQEAFGVQSRESRSRKLSASLASNNDEIDIDVGKVLCEGIDEICVQCMEVINIISECANDPTTPSDRDVLNLPGFANLTLSSKLIEQMNQSMCCVGGALPDWCLAAPAFAPLLFTYESRRLLLERTAFGPSRGTLCQQEAKVNVGKFRQRMASLRARAVELVGEAFAGGAEDPTALQLQADELYGMEEALASKVKSAFRAAKWQEHALQVAKAAVRRDRLLADAAAVMDSYTIDRSACRRRLEIRFEGESGFDAASGDEAGVTRGFYADVAEALLSTDIVAGVCCTPKCSPVASTRLKDAVEIEDPVLKLPLWIPDMDSNMQTIIPTPRAAKDSWLGVFPRPIPSYHPQFDAVIKVFRLMGRLFASALRDGFMFPVPLSASFLKLVQHGRLGRFGVDNVNVLLLSSDLPRPGFIGGEVFAAEFYVCRELDRLDRLDPPLSRHDLKKAYDEIATDPNFGRVAFGKTYDCSFNDYFQDRTFVDPIDPAQDVEAAPLCPRGHSKPITIFNVREWVALAKKFVLYEGVIEQAMAFRGGVEDFFSSEYLRVFTSQELQRDICGVGDDVDTWKESSIRKLFKLDGGNGATEALVAVAAIGGEGGAALSRRFGPSSPTISFLIKALLEASSTQRRQFLNFVTSLPIASVKIGTIEVVPILSPTGEFLPMHDPSCLPRANTCSRRLYLPRFETYESFSEVLWSVVREESRFKGFYEWRGS